MTSGGNSFNYFTGNQPTKFYLAYAELVKSFDCIFITSVKRLDPTGKLR